MLVQRLRRLLSIQPVLDESVFISGRLSRAGMITRLAEADAAEQLSGRQLPGRHDGCCCCCHKRGAGAWGEPCQ